MAHLPTSPSTLNITVGDSVSWTFMGQHTVTHGRNCTKAQDVVFDSVSDFTFTFWNPRLVSVSSAQYPAIVPSRWGSST